MHLRRTAALAASGLLLSAGPALAAEPKADAVYLGFTVGQVRQAALKPADPEDGLLGLSIGYQFNKSFAVEIFSHAYLFPSWVTLFGTNLPGNRSEPTDIADSYTGIAAVGAFPLSDSWRLRGRVGVGRTRVAVYDAPEGKQVGYANRTDPSLGAGLAYDPSARWTLSLDVGRLTKTKVDTVTLGAEFRF